MLSLDLDGTATFSRSDIPEIGIKCFPDGRMRLSDNRGSVDETAGVMIGGDSFVVAKFQHGKPVDTILLFHEGDLIRRVVKDGSVQSETHLGIDGWIEEASGLLRGSGLARIENDLRDVIEGRSKAEPGKWEDLIPQRYVVAAVEDVRELPNCFGLGSCVAAIGGTPVLLSKLTPAPPTGKVHLMPGVEVRLSEVWSRRFERMMSLTDYPDFVLRPVGIVKLRQKGLYVVSILPGDLDLDDILNQPFRDSAFDNVIDTIDQVTRIVKFCHTNGITFNGTLNGQAFLHSADGRCWLNSGYMLARSFDACQSFGGAQPDEFRFFSPSRFCNISLPMKLVVSYIGGVLPDNLPPVKDDLYSLGLFILSLRLHSGIPLDWLGHSHYLLCSVIASSIADSDVPWLSVACKSPVDITASNVAFAEEEDLSPHERIAIKLLRGDISLDDILVSIQRYRDWQDKVMNETSVETEVKAVISRFSSMINKRQVDS